MLKEVRILDARVISPDVFGPWQEALAASFRARGIQASVVPVADSLKPPATDHSLTLAFNLTRVWSSKNVNHFHLAWLVDPPYDHADFFFPQFSHIPVNPATCMVGSVDRYWLAFARDIYLYPNAHFLPHPCLRESLTPPDWTNRDLDVVFFGAMEDTDALRETLLANAGPFRPMLEALVEQYSFAAGRLLEQALMDALRPFNLEKKQTLFVVNAFLGKLARYHRVLERVRLFRSIRRATIHVFGQGPWPQLKLGANIRVHDRIPYAEAVQVMTRAKILLNCTSAHRGGGHERMFDAVTGGCYILSTWSDYLAEEFGTADGFGFYDWTPDWPADDVIERILADDDSPAKVIRSQQRAYERHRMGNRVATICEIYERQFPT